MSDHPDVDKFARKLRAAGYNPHEIGSIIEGALNNKELAHALVAETGIGNPNTKLTQSDRQKIGDRFEKHHTAASLHYSREQIKTYGQDKVQTAGYAERDARYVKDFEKNKQIIEKIAGQNFDPSQLTDAQLRELAKALGKGSVYVGTRRGLETIANIKKAAQTVPMARVPQGFFSDALYTAEQIAKGNRTKQVMRNAGMSTTDRPQQLLGQNDIRGYQSAVKAAEHYAAMVAAQEAAHIRLFTGAKRQNVKSAPKPLSHAARRILNTKPDRVANIPNMLHFLDASPVKRSPNFTVTRKPWIAPSPRPLLRDTSVTANANSVVREIFKRQALKNISYTPDNYPPRPKPTPIISRPQAPMQQSWFARNKQTIIEVGTGIAATAGLLGVTYGGLGMSSLMSHGLPLPFARGGPSFSSESLSPVASLANYSMGHNDIFGSLSGYIKNRNLRGYARGDPVIDNVKYRHFKLGTDSRVAKKLYQDARNRMDIGNQGNYQLYRALEDKGLGEKFYGLMTAHHSSSTLPVGALSYYQDHNKLGMPNLGTAKGYEGNGIASSLMGNLFDHAKSSNYNSVYWDSLPGSDTFYRNKIGAKYQGNGRFIKHLSYGGPTLDLLGSLAGPLSGAASLAMLPIAAGAGAIGAEFLHGLKLKALKNPFKSPVRRIKSYISDVSHNRNLNKQLSRLGVTGEAGIENFLNNRALTNSIRDEVGENSWYKWAAGGANNSNLIRVSAHEALFNTANPMLDRLNRAGRSGSAGGERVLPSEISGLGSLGNSVGMFNGSYASGKLDDKVIDANKLGIKFVLNRGATEYLHNTGGKIPTLRGFSAGGWLSGYAEGTSWRGEGSKGIDERIAKRNEKKNKEAERRAKKDGKPYVRNDWFGKTRAYSTSGRNEFGKHPQYFTDPDTGKNVKTTIFDPTVLPDAAPEMYKTGISRVRALDPGTFKQNESLWRGLSSAGRYKATLGNRTVKHALSIPQMQPITDLLKHDPVGFLMADLNYEKGTTFKGILGKVGTQQNQSLKSVVSKFSANISNAQVNAIVKNLKEAKNPADQLRVMQTAFPKTFATRPVGDTKDKYGNDFAGQDTINRDITEIKENTARSKAAIKAAAGILETFQDTMAGKIATIANLPDDEHLQKRVETQNTRAEIARRNKIENDRLSEQNQQYIRMMRGNWGKDPHFSINEFSNQYSPVDMGAYESAADKARQGYRSGVRGPISGLAQIFSKDLAEAINNNPVMRLMRRTGGGNVSANMTAFGQGFLNMGSEKKHVLTGTASFDTSYKTSNADARVAAQKAYEQEFSLSGDKVAAEKARQKEINRPDAKTRAALQGRYGGIESQISSALQNIDIPGIGKRDLSSAVKVDFVDTWKAESEDFIKASSQMQFSIELLDERLNQLNLDAERKAGLFTKITDTVNGIIRPLNEDTKASTDENGNATGGPGIQMRHSTVDIDKGGLWNTTSMKLNKIAKDFSWKAASISMSSMGVYFSLSGVFMQLQGALSTVLSSLSDLNGVFQNVGYVAAFGGGIEKVNRILGTAQVSQTDLVEGWKSVQYAQASFGLAMSSIAASIFKDRTFVDGLVTSIVGLFDAMREANVMGSFKDLIKASAEAMPALIKGLQWAIGLLSELSKQPWLVQTMIKVAALTMMMQPLTSGISLLFATIATAAELYTVFGGIATGLRAVGLAGAAASMQLIAILAVIEAIGQAYSFLTDKEFKIPFTNMNMKPITGMYNMATGKDWNGLQSFAVGGEVQYTGRDMVPNSPDDTIATVKSGEVVLTKDQLKKLQHFDAGFTSVAMMPSTIKPYDSQSANQNQKIVDPLGRTLEASNITAGVLKDAKNGNSVNVTVMNFPNTFGNASSGEQTGIPFPDIGSLFPARLYGLRDTVPAITPAITPSPSPTPAPVVSNVPGVGPTQITPIANPTPSPSPTVSPTSDSFISVVTAAITNAANAAGNAITAAINIVTNAIESSFDSMMQNIAKIDAAIGQAAAAIGNTVNAIVSKTIGVAPNGSPGPGIVTQAKGTANSIFSALRPPTTGMSDMSELWAQHSGYQKWTDNTDYGAGGTKRNMGFLDWFTTGGYNRQAVPGPNVPYTPPAFDQFKQTYDTTWAPYNAQNRQNIGGQNYIDNNDAGLLFEQSLGAAQVGDNIDAHGIAKGDQLGSLNELLTKGPDTSGGRKFHTAPLWDKSGAGLYLGASGGAYKTGAFTLLSEPGKALTDPKTGKLNVGAVVVNKEQEMMMDALREQYKGTNFITQEQAIDYGKGTLDTSKTNIPVPKLSSKLPSRDIYTPYEMLVPDLFDNLQWMQAAVASEGDPLETAKGAAAMGVGNLVSGGFGKGIQRLSQFAPALIKLIGGKAGSLRGIGANVLGKGLGSVGVLFGKTMQLAGSASVVGTTAALEAGSAFDQFMGNGVTGESSEALKTGQNKGKNQLGALFTSGLASGGFGRGIQVLGGAYGNKSDEEVRAAYAANQGIFDIGIGPGSIMKMLTKTFGGDKEATDYFANLKGGVGSFGDSVRGSVLGKVGLPEDMPLVGGLNLGGSISDAIKGVYDIAEQVSNLDLGTVAGIGVSAIGLGATGVDLAKNTAGAIAENPYTALQLALTAGTPGGFGALLAPLLMPKTTDSLEKAGAENASSLAKITGIANLDATIGFGPEASAENSANTNAIITNATKNTYDVVSAINITRQSRPAGETVVVPEGGWATGTTNVSGGGIIGGSKDSTTDDLSGVTSSGKHFLFNGNEAILKASVAQKYRDEINVANATGKWPGYANGGMLGTSGNTTPSTNINPIVSKLDDNKVALYKVDSSINQLKSSLITQLTNSALTHPLVTNQNTAAIKEFMKSGTSTSSNTGTHDAMPTSSSWIYDKNNPKRKPGRNELDESGFEKPPKAKSDKVNWAVGGNGAYRTGANGEIVYKDDPTAHLYDPKTGLTTTGETPEQKAARIAKTAPRLAMIDLNYAPGPDGKPMEKLHWNQGVAHQDTKSFNKWFNNSTPSVLAGDTREQSYAAWLSTQKAGLPSGRKFDPSQYLNQYNELNATPQSRFQDTSYVSLLKYNEEERQRQLKNGINYAPSIEYQYLNKQSTPVATPEQTVPVMKSPYIWSQASSIPTNDELYKKQIDFAKEMQYNPPMSGVAGFAPAAGLNIIPEVSMPAGVDAASAYVSGTGKSIAAEMFSAEGASLTAKAFGSTGMLFTPDMFPIPDVDEPLTNAMRENQKAGSPLAQAYKALTESSLVTPATKVNPNTTDASGNRKFGPGVAFDIKKADFSTAQYEEINKALSSFTDDMLFQMLGANKGQKVSIGKDSGLLSVLGGAGGYNSSSKSIALGENLDPMNTGKLALHEATHAYDSAYLLPALQAKGLDTSQLGSSLPGTDSARPWDALFGGSRNLDENLAYGMQNMYQNSQTGLNMNSDSATLANIVTSSGTDISALPGSISAWDAALQQSTATMKETPANATPNDGFVQQTELPINLTFQVNGSDKNELTQMITSVITSLFPSLLRQYKSNNFF